MIELDINKKINLIRPTDIKRVINNSLEIESRNIIDDMRKSTLNATYSYQKGRKKRTFGTRGLIRQTGRLANSLEYRVIDNEAHIYSNSIYGARWENKGGAYKWFSPIVQERKNKIVWALREAINKLLKRG